ncbi:hypothetical protein EOPP23_13390 [Endozoicomonas sp. OPT23]|nr:hypothetical protein [Endozoicomonas sp. OPT23]
MHERFSTGGGIKLIISNFIDFTKNMVLWNKLLNGDKFKDRLGLGDRIHAVFNYTKSSENTKTLSAL